MDQKLADAAACVLGRCCMCTHQMAALLCEMMSWLPSWLYNVMSEIRFRQSMHIYLKNNRAKFHPVPIW